MVILIPVVAKVVETVTSSSCVNPNSEGFGLFLLWSILLIDMTHKKRRHRCFNALLLEQNCNFLTGPRESFYKNLFVVFYKPRRIFYCEVDELCKKIRRLEESLSSSIDRCERLLNILSNPWALMRRFPNFQADFSNLQIYARRQKLYVIILGWQRFSFLVPCWAWSFKN